MGMKQNTQARHVTATETAGIDVRLGIEIPAGYSYTLCPEEITPDENHPYYIQIQKTADCDFSEANASEFNLLVNMDGLKLQQSYFNLSSEEAQEEINKFLDRFGLIMVENSLGRLWLEGHPNAELHDGWKYYLDEAEQEPEVEVQLAKLREEYKTIKPEEIKVIDPCMGSGHILVYAFDVLMQIYTSAGWDQREAAQSILKNNLYGLDIDDRAAQLAYFAVMMKARQYDRRLLTRGIQPNIYSIRESNGIQAMIIEYFHKNDPKLKADIERIVTKMRDAKEYGSILNITPVDFAGLYARFDEIRNDINMMQMSALDELLPLVKCAEVLAQKYNVVVTNPPYMAVSNAGAKVNDYVKKNFPDSKADMFAVFIERCGQMTKKNGYQAMITQHAWMFLSSFEKLRAKLLAVDIVNMAHLGARAFEEIGGEVVQTTSFVIRKSHIADYKGEYCRLIEPTSQQGKENMFLSGENRYEADQSNFSKIPGSPVAYWVNQKAFTAFENVKISDYYTVRNGISTGNNEKYEKRI